MQWNRILILSFPTVEAGRKFEILFAQIDMIHPRFVTLDFTYSHHIPWKDFCLNEKSRELHGRQGIITLKMDAWDAQIE